MVFIYTSLQPFKSSLTMNKITRYFFPLPGTAYRSLSNTVNSSQLPALAKLWILWVLEFAFNTSNCTGLDLKKIPCGLEGWKHT